MAEYKLTFAPPEENLKRLKEKGAYPFPYGGVNWEVGMQETVTDLSPFYDGEKAKRHVHDFLQVELIEEQHEAPEATD